MVCIPKPSVFSLRFVAIIKLADLMRCMQALCSLCQLESTEFLYVYYQQKVLNLVAFSL